MHVILGRSHVAKRSSSASKFGLESVLKYSITWSCKMLRFDARLAVMEGYGGFYLIARVSGDMIR
jgi:hypothetical protein